MCNLLSSSDPIISENENLRTEHTRATPPRVLSSAMARALIISTMLAVAFAGPMDYLRPYDKFAGDQQKLLEQIAKDKAAKEGISNPPLVPPANEDDASEEEAAPQSEPESAPAATSAIQHSKIAASGLRIGPLNLGKGPAGLTLVAAAGFGAQRMWSARVEKALEADLDAECAAIRELTLANRVERPSGCSKRAALAELRSRKQLLTEQLLPQLRTLE